jgi:hypothetical protein
MKVFISHSSTDRWIARQICHQLEAMEIEAFLDEKDIETGDSINDSIQAHLADCDEILLLLSPASLKSDWVLIELGGAKALKKRLVPILLHVGPNELPDVLTDERARDINEIERYYGEVKSRSGDSKEERATELALQKPTESRRVARAPRSFGVGDLVRLPREIPSSTYARNGRDIGWSEHMERYLGEETKVRALDEDRGIVNVEVDDGHWYWLMDWLDPVEGQSSG